MPKQPLSETLIDTIRVALLHGGVLVRLPRFRGCWTWRNCPMKRALDAAHLDMPKWWVGDNTVRSLLWRGIAVVTHVREHGRPAVVQIVSEA
jgi:hypothetical protein